MSLRGVMTGGRDGATTAGLSCPLTLPAGCVAGDVAVVISSANLGAPTASIDASWTTLRDGDVANTNNKAYLWSKALTSADITAGTVTVTWSATGRTIASGVVHYGVTGVESVTYADPQTPAIPTVTTTVDGSDVLLLAASRTDTGGATVATYPAGYTKVTDAKTAFATTGVNTSNSIAELDTPGPAGTYGGGTMQFSVPVSSSHSYAVALTPVVTPPVVTGNVTELQAALQAIAGVSLDAQGAANVWAGTSGLDLLGALNHKNGTTGLGLLAVLNELADLDGTRGAGACVKAMVSKYVN